MSYLDLIKDTILGKNDIVWNYYNIPMHISLEHLLNNSEADRFIRDYFNIGMKKTALMYNRNQYMELPAIRKTHTVSCFFLGLIIENCLNGHNTLALENDSYFPFSYLWFLTSLYHDYGYSISENENNDSYQKKLLTMCDKCDFKSTLRKEYNIIRRAKKELEINISPFVNFSSAFRVKQYIKNYIPELPSHSQKLVNESLAISDNTISTKLNLHFTDNIIIRKHQYLSRTVTRYFNYRLSVGRKVDHGIIGGFIFFDKMIKNYIHAYIQLISDIGKPVNISNFCYNNLKFSKEQFTVFSYISDCILAHNIWKQSEKSRDEYNDFKLAELYPENFNPITYTSNPLLYILVVADTLEPTKIYKNIDPTIVANAIDIKYEPKSRKLDVYCNDNRIEIGLLHKKAIELSEWTSVTCSELYNNKFTLYI